MSDTATIEQKPDILTARKLKTRKIISASLQGKSYTEIGNELIPHSKNPRQAVYSALRTDHAQADIRENFGEEIDEWNEKKIATEIMKLAKNAKNDGNKIKALELLAKWKAMLTEKREVSNKQSFETSKGTKNISTFDLIAELESRCKLSSQGINTSEGQAQEPVNVPQVGNNAK